MKRHAFSAAILISLIPGSAFAPRSFEDDRAAVIQAGLDYLDAIYQGKPELIERSVHKKLNKLGFGRRTADQAYRMGKGMNYRQLLSMARKKDRDYPEDPIREVKVLDLLDQTAAIRVKAEWGYDYMLLGKFDADWKIMQVLWQSFEHASSPEFGSEVLAAGQALFARGMCNKCHGDAGKGGERAPDLTDADWIHCDGSVEGIQEVIVNGVAKEDLADSSRPHAMNPIGSRLQLEETELEALAAYVKSLSKN